MGTDTPIGKFDGESFLMGEVADWVLLNESLSVEEMDNYVTCHGLPMHVQPILSFDSLLSKWELKGQIYSYNLTRNDVCGQRLVDSMVMFPHPVEQGIAADWCQWMGGVLPLPLNHEENKDVTALSSEYESECRKLFDSVAWLGIKGNITTKEWSSLKDGSPTIWDNFDTNHDTPTKYRACAVLGSENLHGLWYSTACSYFTCALCQFADRPIFTLRGLCSDTYFDTTYTIFGTLNKRPLYVGDFRSSIYWNGSEWILKTAYEQLNYTARMLNITKAYPNGRSTWVFNERVCGVLKVSSFQFYLHLHIFGDT